MRKAGYALALVAAFGLGRASTWRPAEPKVDTKAVRDAKALERQLDELEAGLSAGEGWVMHGEDLRRRHERVSVLQCENAKMQLDITARMQAHARRKLEHLENVASARLERSIGEDDSGLSEVAATK